MKRKELEALAGQLNVSFDETTTDEVLQLRVQVAQKEEELSMSSKALQEQAAAIVELEQKQTISFSEAAKLKAMAAGSNKLPVIEHKGKVYQVTAPKGQFRRHTKTKNKGRYEKRLVFNPEVVVFTAEQLINDAGLVAELLAMGSGMLKEVSQ